MTVVLLGTLSFFSWSFQRRLRQVALGTSDPRFEWSLSQIVARTTKVLVTAVGQEKMWKKRSYALAGFAHMTIFFAFGVLLLNSILLWIRGFDYDFDFWGILSVHHPIGQLYFLGKELAAAGAMAGAVGFWYLRLGKKGVDSGDPEAVGERARMTLGKKPDQILSEPNIILGIIFTMMLADFLYVGAHLALEAQAMGTDVHWTWYEPFGAIFGLAFKALPRDAVQAIEWIGWAWHGAWVLLFLNLLPYTKHFHILTVMPSVFSYDMRPNSLTPVDDLEGRVEREESLGIGKLADLTHSHILDLYTCTECGRCSDNCPAFITDKALSPKHVTLALRDHLYATEKPMFAKVDGVVTPQDGPTVLESHVEEGEEIHTYPKPPKAKPHGTEDVLTAYVLNDQPGADLVPEIMHPDVIWSCTTCRACEEQCPVMITYVDKIVGMRREMVMNKAEFPPLLQKAFNGIETNGNPWNYSRMDRADWTKGLDVPTIEDNPRADVLFWVGCAAAYDEEAQNISRSMVKLFEAAHVDYAILGSAETCTGDPARRAGNEFLFQMIAEQNIEQLNEVAAKKTIVTTCPHCFNTLANEYPDFGGTYDVVHHADFLNGLLSAGKLKPVNEVRAKVTYHDSCYLGRYNKIYDSPRQVLEAIAGVELVEVEYWNKEQGLCCGAGGAQYFMEETGGEKVNDKRTLQLIDTGATAIASACPFCMGMVKLGLKNADKEESVRQLDIAQMLAEAVEVRATTEDAPAAAE